MHKNGIDNPSPNSGRNCVLRHANTFEEGMNPSIPPVMGK